MSASLEDITKVIALVRGEADTSAVKEYLAEVSNGIAELIEILGKPREAMPLPAPVVNVEVLPTPIHIDAPPAAQLVPSPAQPPPWNSMTVDAVKDANGNFRLTITRD